MKKLILTLGLLLGFLTSQAATYTITPVTGNMQAATDQSYISGTWAPFGVKIYTFVSFTKATQCKLYSPLRWYGGQRLVITAPEGELITKVEMTLAADTKSGTMMSYAGGEVVDAAAVAAGEIISWSNPEGVAEFDAAATDQTRISTFKITTEPSNGKVPAPLIKGNGTEENPYDCEDIIIFGKPLKTPSSTNKYWVEGYIVGVVKTAGVVIGETNWALSFAIADTPSETDPAKCIAVAVPTALKAELSLQSNPGNLGKHIMVHGGLGGYLNTVGVSAPDEYKWVEDVPEPQITTVNSVEEILALPEGTLFETAFPLTVAYAYYNNVYACDANGKFIQLYGDYGLKTNDVIPAGLKGDYTKFGSTPQIENLILPEGITTGSFTPAAVAAADVTTALVNSVIKIENVSFAAATPAAAENFTGTADGTELNFYNRYGLASHGAGKYDVTVVVTIFNGAPSLYVIDMEEVVNEVDNVKEIIALDDNSLIETTFPLTVAFANSSEAYVCDAAGNFIKIETNNVFKAGDVIAAGLTGRYTLLNGNTPCITEATIPAATAGTFTPATVAAAEVTTALVNSVIKLENVTFDTATPAAAENFTGTANGATLTFCNAYGLASQGAGKYDLTAVVTIQNGAAVLNVIDMEEVMNEAGSIAEILALDNNSLLTTTFPLTVAFAQNGDAYVLDEAGDYILVTGAQNLFAGDAIPAGLVGKYSLEGEVPQIAATTVPAATEGSYTPEVEDAANVTVEMVNHVFILNDVRFAEDTPSGNEANFTGTCGDIEFAFANKYSIEGVPAGLYHVTVAVSILDNAPLLYVISYQESADNIRNAGDIAAFIGNCTEESFPNVAINNPVVALYQNGDYLYIKDESGYLLVYGDTKQTYTNGMIIPAGITGKAENNEGVYQLSSPVAETFKAGEAGEIVMPEFIDYSEIATTAVNTYVYMNSLTFNQDLEGEWTLLAGGVVLPMENKFDIEFIEGGVATVSGFIGLNDGEAVFYPTSVEMDAPVPTPTFSVKAGNVEVGTVVEIECADPDATIYYNTDGSNTYIKVYTDPIVITENTTIKAIAINHGERSLTARATYTVDGSEGIEAIDADDATVEYYNLQGVRVANPENGLFIRRQGGKAVKVIVK